MGRPVLLALSVVVVGVHGIARIHGGQKQKDIKSEPQSEITPSTPFLGRGCISYLRVRLNWRISPQILFRITVITEKNRAYLAAGR